MINCRYTHTHTNVSGKYINKKVLSIKTHAAVAGKIILSFVSVIILGILAVIIFTVAALLSGSDLDGFAASMENNSALQYIQICLFIASAYGMYALFERKKGWSIGLKQKTGAKEFLIGALSGIILISLSALIIIILDGASWERTVWDREVVQSLLLGLLLFSAVSLSEEIYSRGYIQGLLKYHYGSTVAIIVSSLLFTLLHSMNQSMFSTPIPFINILLAGIIMALARELTGGLWWPIGLHLTWNFFQGYVYGFNVSGTELPPSILRTIDKGPAWLSGGPFGIEGSIIAVMMLLIGIAGLYFYYSKKPKADNQPPAL